MSPSEYKKWFFALVNLIFCRAQTMDTDKMQTDNLKMWEREARNGESDTMTFLHYLLIGTGNEWNKCGCPEESRES